MTRLKGVQYGQRSENDGLDDEEWMVVDSCRRQHGNSALGKKIKQYGKLRNRRTRFH